MSQILNSLVISEGPETGRALEKAMMLNLEGHVLSIITAPLAAIDALDRLPDLIFIDDSTGSLPTEDALRVTMRFPRTTCVVLSDCDDDARRRLMRAGVDEVMRLDDLSSAVGRHLLEKLLTLKELADAERLMAQSEERFRGIIEHAHDIILLIDNEGTIVYTSPAFGKQTGFDEWEVLGQTLPSFVHPDDADAVRMRLAETVSARAGQVHAVEMRLRTRQEKFLAFEAVMTNQLGNDTVRSVIVNMRDITAQKSVESELEQYRQHLEQLVDKRTREVAEVQSRANKVIDASPDALLAMDNAGQILFISEHYKLSYPQSAPWLVPGRNVIEAYDKVAREIGFADHDPRYKAMMDWWAAPRGSKEFRLNNGTWLRLRAKVMQENRGVVVSTTNITDYKRQQMQLAEKSAALEQALETERGIVEQQKTFVSMVSHEFRTPLTIIDGNAQIIQSRAAKLDPTALMTRAGTIRSSVDRLVRLIESILSTHMLDSGKLSVDIAPCDISAILRAAINDQQDLSPSHKIRFDLRDLPKKMALDEKVIRQMMANLLSNAVKYSPGKDLVEVVAFGLDDKVTVEVRDHGVGIPQKELPRIASKYFRASTATGIPGTGLGLSLVKQFVELHHGEFNIDSEEGKGTVVTVMLPVKK